MPAEWTPYACLVLGLSSALVGGVLKGFSEFIMKGLLRTNPAGGIEAMQHINRTVMRTEFLVSFMALAPLSLAFAIYAGLNLAGLERTFVIAAALVYCASVFLVTVAGNVPMNERLAKLDFASQEAAEYWAHYGRKWTQLNHVRTLGAVATATLYFMAMLALA
ncbi:MAG: anthrone oxygenase family protein [Pseudomonadota bacterium]